MLSESDSRQRLLNFDASKPSDWDDSFSFLHEEEQKIKVLEKLDEVEEICWLENKLNSATHFKKKQFDEKKKKLWDLDGQGGFFDSKGHFISDKLGSLTLDTFDHKKNHKMQFTQSGKFNQSNQFTQNGQFSDFDGDLKSSPNQAAYENNSKFFYKNQSDKSKHKQNDNKNDNNPFFKSFKQNQSNSNFNKSSFLTGKSFKNSQPKERRTGSPFYNTQSNLKFTVPKESPKEEETLWFLKADSELLGPLTTNELIGEIKKSENQVKIKKINDKFFVESQETTIKSLEKDYSDKKAQVESEKKEILQKSESIAESALSSPGMDQVENRGSNLSDKLTNCKSSAKMLKRMGISLKLREIYTLAKDKTKNDAVSELFKATNVPKGDLIDFMDTFLSEIGIQVVKDVDKDGFQINLKQNKL